MGTPPTLQDFRDVLLQQPEPEAHELALELELFTRGALNTFAKQTNVDTSNSLICYDIFELGEQLRAIGMLVILDSIMNRIAQNREKGKKTFIYIDEIYLLFMHEYSTQFLYKLWKRVRKYGAYCTGITQNVSDLLQSYTARTMLSNSEFIVMLNQAASDRIELAKLLNISEDQLNYITNVEAGHGLMKIGSNLVPFENDFPKNTELYKLMTTKIDESTAFRKQERTSGKRSVTPEEEAEFKRRIMEIALTDAGGDAARAGAEIIQHARASNSQDEMQSVEFIQQKTAEFGSDSAFSAESDELIQHRAAEYGRKRIENEKLDRKLADRETILDAGERNNNVIFDRSSSGREGGIIDARKVSFADAGSINGKRVQQRQKEYAINKLKKQRENSPRTFWIGRQECRTSSKTADVTSRLLRKIAEDAKAMLTTYSAVGAVLLMVVVITILFSVTFMTVGDEAGNNFAYDFYEIGPGDTAIVKVAQAQLGNVGGNKFWKWYGFGSHVHWCACFVSWCGDQCGYIKAGIIPKYDVCGTGADWFKARHRWANRGYSPKPGDIIFFDFEHDGEMDHTGIVESSDGKTVTTIEGNSGNACKRQSYVIGSSQIAGYGVPAYPGGTGDQKKDKGENTKEAQ